MSKYTEKELDEYYQPYDIDRSMGCCGYTDGYVETDMETGIPVVVFYNEDNLSKIGLNVNRMLKLGRYEQTREALSEDVVTFESQYGRVCLGMWERWNAWGDGIDGELVTNIGADIENPECQLAEKLFEVNAPAHMDEEARFEEYCRACWNAAMRMLRNFAE